MAVIAFEGFDNWAVANGTDMRAEARARGYVPDDNQNSLAAPGRMGVGRCLHCRNDRLFGFVPTVTGTTYTSGSFSGAFKIIANGAKIQLNDVNNVNLDVTLQPTSYSISYNPAGTDNDITVTSVAVGTGYNGYVWNHVEVVWSPTLFELKINGAVIYTKAFTAFPGFRSIYFGNGAYGENYWDDVVAKNDAAYLGDARCFTQTNIATVSNTGTVVGAADAHTALNSADNATSYIAFSADAQQVMVEPLDIQGSPTTIHAVGVAVSSRKNNVNSVNERLIVKTSIENLIGAAYNTHSTDFSGRRYILTSDPADSSSWTVSKFNAIEVGIKRGT